MLIMRLIIEYVDENPGGQSTVYIKVGKHPEA